MGVALSLCRGCSRKRTHAVRSEILCSQAQPYGRTPGWCVSLISSYPFTSLTIQGLPPACSTLRQAYALGPVVVLGRGALHGALSNCR
jgi:hypothetical protein